MKKNKNKAKQKVYMKRRILAVVLVVLGIFLLIFGIQRRNKIQKLALGENALEIGGGTLDVSKVLSEEPNPPQLGAGMIPIKWNGANWVITTSDDPEWYNYSQGKWATVMLSDGKYSSELSRDKELARVGVGVPDDPQILGTIFTWIPRLAYLEDNVAFLQGVSMIEYQWTTEDCFNLKGYGANYIDLGVTGFWIGQKEYENMQELEEKNNEFNSEENTQGLIANEKVTRLQESEKLVIEKLYKKSVGVGVPDDPMNPNTMTNRQIIKIVNTNNRLPIMGSHTIDTDNQTIHISAKYGNIAFVTDKDGNRLVGNTYPLGEENTTYTFYIVDTNGNIRKYKMAYGSGKPNLKGFNLSNTFYCIYDEQGNETSEIPAGENPPEEWYNYDAQRWANIAVRDNGNVTYYTWIPRYMYTLDNENQKVNAKLVDLNNVWTDPENPEHQVNLENKTDENNQKYVLPEAFTWQDPENPNDKIQLAGFWMSKFKLREGESAKLSNIVGGIGTITIRDITKATETNTTTGENKYICELYLIKDGKRIKLNEANGQYENNKEPIILEDTEYLYDNLEKGNYTINIIIKDAETKLQVSTITKQVAVMDENSVSKPNLDGYDKDHTFYVTYNNEGQEESYIPITEDMPKNWYNYFDRKWANIVVRMNENETYYTWIPRYEYALNNEEQRTDVNFIQTTQTEATSGYKIPEAFTWQDPENENEKIQLDGFWMSKFKLREGVEKEKVSNNIYGVGNAINIDNIATNDTTYDYYAYAYSKEKDENGKSKYKYWNQITSVSHTIDGSKTIGDIEVGKGEVAAGDYVVTVLIKDKQGNLVAGVSRDVTVIETVKAYQPDTKYYVASDEKGNISIESAQTLLNTDITYYVEYNKECTSITNTDQTLNMTQPEKWYNYDDKTDLTNNPLLDATIVVRENDYNTYYKWVPRYQYSTTIGDKDASSRTYISVDKTEPDEGYEIPSQFKDAEGNPLKYTDGTNIKGYWKQVDQVANTINATVITTENEIKLTNITLPNNTTGKIKLTSNSKIVGEYDLEDIEGDSFTYSNLESNKKYEVSIFAYDTAGKIVDIFVLEEKTFKVIVDIEAQNFNKSNTFYVFYDENGNEESYIPIGTKLTKEQVEQWYNYEERRWANVVVRDNYNTTYYTWVPRYEYKLQEVNQKASIIFIPQEQDKPDIGYQIPEAFTWQDPNNENGKIQLAGYWMSKFKLREGDMSNPKIDGINGKIKIEGITQATEQETITNADGTTTQRNKYICEIYLIQNGVVQRKDTLTQTDYTYNLPAGTYTVNIIIKKNDDDESKQIQMSAITRQVTVTDDDFANAPNLDGFDKAHTYYVVYDENGNETSDKLITGSAPANWYDYSDRKWANIVVRQNGGETYYTWIPRYCYRINQVIDQKTDVEFIKGTADAPSGYTLPEAFTWQDPNNENYKIQLEGYWMSKFKLRENTAGSIITLTGNTIDMSKVMTNTNYTYTACLYNNNEGATKGNLISSTGGSTFSISTPGHYTVNIMVKDENGNHVVGISQDIDYGTTEELNAIDAQYKATQGIRQIDAVAKSVEKSMSKIKAE